MSTDFLQQLQQLIEDEQEVAYARLFELWQRPLADKLRKGISQGFAQLDPGPEPGTLWAWPDGSESRFREGDLLLLHQGDALTPLGRQLSFEAEDESRWLLRGEQTDQVLKAYQQGVCYAEPDTLNMAGYYRLSLEEIGSSRIGQELLLPLLMGRLEPTLDEEAMDEALHIARREQFNERQAEAVSWAHGAHHVACIQGPPGTGKTRVLGLIVRLAVARGERVLVSSHTHTAINNALNAIAAHGVPLVKVGGSTQSKGLHAGIPMAENLKDWQERPERPGYGYAVGATPFATCSRRLQDYSFDTVVFDEASQITLPLALMAMRKARRYIFIGDQRQLPPVLLTRSVLDERQHSVFAHLTHAGGDHVVMLEETYRMNQWLAAWPSSQYYGGRLQATGSNAQRQLHLDWPAVAPQWQAVLAADQPLVFIPTRDTEARTSNPADAELVAELCEALIGAGLPAHAIGIVSPFRAQGRLIRKQLQWRLGLHSARQILADTVERMQGQEREVVILSLASGEHAFISAAAAFLFQPERINVSITRAKTKLVVIGPEGLDASDIEHPTLRRWLQQYHSLLAHCHRVPL